jgi:hypothetical protein
MLCLYTIAAVGAAGRESYARGILAGSYLLVAALEVVATVGYAVEGRPRDAAATGLLPLPALVLGVGVWVVERRILNVLALCAAAYVFILVRRVLGRRRRRWRAAAACSITTCFLAHAPVALGHSDSLSPRAVWRCWVSASL